MSKYNKKHKNNAEKLNIAPPSGFSQPLILVHQFFLFPFLLHNLRFFLSFSNYALTLSILGETSTDDHTHFFYDHFDTKKKEACKQNDAHDQ